MTAQSSEQSIFLHAIGLTSPAERAGYLDEACQDKPGLRAEIDALLAAHDRLGGMAATTDQTRGAIDAGLVGNPAPERPGTEDVGALVAGRYKLLEVIGEGGMGTVYMAQQTEPVRRLVALKLIKSGMDSRQIIARFAAERQALALMDHPNIARVLDAGTTGSEGGLIPGRPYFVMELVKGIPLTVYCDDHRLTPRQRLDLFIPVCHAIQHAHQKGIIHRDIKPSNVLVARYDGKPVPKVIDFGIAKATGQQLTDQTMVTGFGAVVGTLEYMSPEQAELNQLDIDTRSDIYSLGVLLYELLTGTTPLEKKRIRRAALDEMLRVIREEEPPRPSTRLSTTEELPSIAANRGSEPRQLSGMLRRELDWIVMKALEKDRNRRYETANSLALDIQHYLNDEPVQACPPSATYRFRKFVRRHKGRVIAAGVLLLSLILGIIGTSAALVWAVRERDEKARALIAESKSLAAEKQSRIKAMDALSTLTDEVVEDQMARSPSLSDENKEFLRKVIQQYEGLAAITADDADSRALRAEGYHRVGIMRERLGEYKEAEKTYGMALTLLRQLVIDFPRRFEFKESLAGTYNNLGILCSKVGRQNDAESAFSAAVTLQKELLSDSPSHPKYRQAFAATENNRGNLLQSISRFKESEEALVAARDFYLKLTQDFPSQPEYRIDLARTNDLYGNLLEEMGRLAEAQDTLDAARVGLEQAINDFPTRTEIRDLLAYNHANRGKLYFTRRQFNDAEKAFANAVILRKQLADEFPSKPEYLLLLAKVYSNVATAQSNLGRKTEAETAYKQAIALFEQMMADSPSKPGLRLEVAMCRMNLGILLTDMDRLHEAEEAIAGALSVFKQDVTKYPDDSDLQNAAAAACVNLARVRSSQRDYAGAKAILEEGLPYHRAALKGNQQNPTYRQFYRNNLIILAQTHAHLGEPSSALATAHTLRDMGWDAVNDAYDAACILALCIPIAQSNEQAQPQEREKQTAFYAEEAVGMLRHAIAKGYGDTPHMKADHDLDSLRERDDFKKLIEKLEATSRPSAKEDTEKKTLN